MHNTGLFLTLLLALAISATAFAQPRKGMHSPMEGQHMMKFMDDLNLSEAQQKDFQKLRDESSKQMIANRAKKATLGVELRELFRADSPNKGAIDKKLGEISQIESQMRQQRTDHWFAVNKILTPDQQKAWKKCLAEGPMMKQRRGMMMNREMRGGMRGGMQQRMQLHHPNPW